MATGSGAENASSPTSMRLKITCKADMMCFIRAVLQSFLNNVNPTESGLKDVLIQNNIISITDEEWLDGKDVLTTRDVARRLLIRLAKLPVDTFLSKVAPDLCDKFPHIIPRDFILNEDEECNLQEEDFSLNLCLYHSLQNQTHPKIILDLLYEHDCLQLEEYEALTADAHNNRGVWSQIFQLFSSQPQDRIPRLAQGVGEIMRAQSIDVPSDLDEKLSRGFPCTCSKGADASPTNISAVMNKVTEWLHQVRITPEDCNTADSNFYSDSDDILSLRSDKPDSLNNIPNVSSTMHSLSYWQERQRQVFDPISLASPPTTNRSGQQGFINLRIVEGDISKQLVDVIVNTATAKLLLTGGGVSNAILKAAGSNLQDECKSKYPDGIKPGDIACTGGHRLACKEIYHVTLFAPYTSDCRAMIHRITFKCVQTAHDAGYSSIALPALGTGNLLYPPSDCAREMLGAIRKFQKGAHLKKSVVNAGLREIVIVIYDNQGVFQTFMQEFHTPSNPRAFGNLTIYSVVSENIALQKVDVIVNTTTPSLNLANGAVTGALLKVGGYKLQEDCTKKYPQGVRTGEIARTRGHRLSCKEVFHIALPAEQFTPDNQMIVSNITMKCLKEASKSKYTTIAFPALGTGKLKYPAGDVACIMRDAIKQFEENEPFTSLVKVIFAIYENEPTFEVS